METLTRRQMLSGLAATAAAGLAACSPVSQAARESDATPSAERTGKADAEQRMPVVFLPHGGGPWPFVETGFGAPGALASYLKKLHTVPKSPPKALLVVSAHWEAERPTVMTARNPPMLYDYYGFPEKAYHVTWPAPGAPLVAERTRELLEAAGIASAAAPSRGFDHGTFTVAAVAYPDAACPTFQLSLKRNLSPRDHLQIGRAVAPLRYEGVFIIGSGMSYHNLPRFIDALRGTPGSMETESRAFDEWLEAAVTADPSTVESKLIEWEKAPFARDCHPREEHLLPLMVVAGAAEDDVGHVPYRDIIYGAHTSAVQFG